MKSYWLAESDLNGKSLKLGDMFTYHGSNITSTKGDVNIYQEKVWTLIRNVLIEGKFDLSDRIKQNFFVEVAGLVLMYKCTT